VQSFSDRCKTAARSDQKKEHSGNAVSAFNNFVIFIKPSNNLKLAYCTKRNIQEKVFITFLISTENTVLSLIFIPLVR
jgi:hypothetical protein